MVNLRVSVMEESEILLQPRSCLGIGVGGFLLLLSSTHTAQKHPFDGEDKLEGKRLCQEVAVEVYSPGLALCLLESHQANSATLPEIWFIMFSISSISLGVLVRGLIPMRVLSLPSPA